MNQNEIDYQLAVAVLRQLKTNGLLTEEEFNQGNCILLEKYHPYIAELLL